jgi:hypothetical protein
VSTPRAEQERSGAAVADVGHRTLLRDLGLAQLDDHIPVTGEAATGRDGAIVGAEHVSPTGEQHREQCGSST